MRDGRPNPDIWGNIITCGEIAVGIYEIVGTKKRGLEVPKAVAEEILPESVEACLKIISTLAINFEKSADPVLAKSADYLFGRR